MNGSWRASANSSSNWRMTSTTSALSRGASAAICRSIVAAARVVPQRPGPRPGGRTHGRRQRVPQGGGERKERVAHLLAGVKEANSQCSLPGKAPARSRGSRPAWSSEDLPVPELPTMARKRQAGSRRRASSSSVSRLRPKKMADLVSANARRPGYGEPCQVGFGGAELSSGHGRDFGEFGRYQGLKITEQPFLEFSRCGVAGKAGVGRAVRIDEACEELADPTILFKPLVDVGCLDIDEDLFCPPIEQHLAIGAARIFELPFDSRQIGQPIRLWKSGNGLPKRDQSTTTVMSHWVGIGRPRLTACCGTRVASIGAPATGSPQVTASRDTLPRRNGS